MVTVAKNTSTGFKINFVEAGTFISRICNICFLFCCSNIVVLSVRIFFTKGTTKQKSEQKYETF